MEIKVEGSTKEGYVAPKEELEKFSGHAAGVCYMPGTFEELMNEPDEKALIRANMTKGSGHHSVFDHDWINFSFMDIPKGLAMVLNNEKEYTTSEKSARYTKMNPTPKEKELYEHWKGIFEGLIYSEYGEKYPQMFTDKKISKLAQENARYLISAFTPTTMVYSTSLRQINYLYAMLEQEIENPNSNEFMTLLKPAMKDFCSKLKETPYIDFDLQKGAIKKARALSLFNPRDYSPTETFGDVYLMNYLASFACVAQAQRHRTINYQIRLLDEKKFYVPPILRGNEALTEQWLKDCNTEGLVFPQGTLVEVNESGTMDDMTLKAKERRCGFAQLEIDNSTTENMARYLKELEKTNHPRAEEFKKYTHGSRCTFPDYTCDTPCGFPEAVKGTRLI